MKSFMAWFLRNVLHYRSDVVMVNLSRSFPQKSYEEIREIYKRFYLHLVTVFTEMLWFGTCRGERGCKKLHRSRLVEFSNPEIYNRLAAGSRQVMILESHTGNWELIGGVLNYSYGEPLDIAPDRMAITYLRLHNSLADRFMARNRTGVLKHLGFQGYLEAGQVMRFALEHRAEKYCYCFITDQFPYTAKRQNVEFLHQETPTMTGAASLAVKLDMAVGYLRFECREGGGYRLTVLPICEHAAGQDPAQIMKRYYQLLEEDLEKQPWNYLWTHKRWK